MRKLLNRKIVEQNRKCGICLDAFTNCNDIVPDHILIFAMLLSLSLCSAVYCSG
jgi:hypothetical protein